MKWTVVQTNDMSTKDSLEVFNYGRKLKSQTEGQMFQSP
jgi:hypothetical protein